MLRLMRKKAQSWMIKVLFAMIIIVFIFFYGYGRKSGQQRVIAEINGTKIADSLFRSEYQKAYQDLARLYQSIYKDRFDESMIDRLTLKERVLNDLIDQTLLAQEAERLSLRVTPEELRAALHSTPAFQVDGKFSQQRFLAILQMNQMSVDEFQAMGERERLITKLTDLISLGAVQLSDQEVLDAYRLENEKINLQFVRFDPTAYEGSVSADGSELEVYFSEKSAIFEVPPRVEVQYIVFVVDDYLETVEISPEEIREEYEYDRDQYRIPKRVKVSHILIKTDGEGGEKTEEEARKMAEQILEEATRGVDFAALAREYSEDPDSAKKGGSIGWVREGRMAPEFAEVAFSLHKDEIGPLTESDDGFHIVKADDVQEARVKGLEEVEEKIRAELARAKGRQLAEDEAQEAFFGAYDTKDMESCAAEKGRTLTTTGLFSRNERVEQFGGNLAFNEQAFSLQQGEVSPPLRIGDKIYLMKVIRRENSQIPPFEEVKEKVRTKVRQEKAMEKAKSLAEALLEEIKTGKSLADSAAPRALKVEETGLFERGSPFIPKVGSAQDLGREIFLLSQDNTLLDKVVSSGRAFFVMALEEEQKIDMEKFESEKEQYEKRLNADKRGRILRYWLDSLRRESDIKIVEQNLMSF